jgi:hypothetical protein
MTAHFYPARPARRANSGPAGKAKSAPGGTQAEAASAQRDFCMVMIVIGCSPAVRL